MDTVSTSQHHGKKEETKEETQADDRSGNSNVVLSKQKIVLSKETGLKPKSRLQVVQSSGSQYSGQEGADHTSHNTE